MLVHQDGAITIKEKEFQMSEGPKGIIDTKRVIKEHVTSDDLRTYKKILLLTNAQLEGYQPGSVINVSRGKKFREIIVPISRVAKAEESNRGTPCMQKILRFPTNYYITILPNRHLSAP